MFFVYCIDNMYMVKKCAEYMVAFNVFLIFVQMDEMLMLAVDHKTCVKIRQVPVEVLGNQNLLDVWPEIFEMVHLRYNTTIYIVNANIIAKMKNTILFLLTSWVYLLSFL